MTCASQESVLRLSTRHARSSLVVATDGVWGPFEGAAAGGGSAGSEHVAWLVEEMRSRGVRAGDAAQEILACARRGRVNRALCPAR